MFPRHKAVCQICSRLFCDECVELGTCWSCENIGHYEITKAIGDKDFEKTGKVGVDEEVTSVPEEDGLSPEASGDGEEYDDVKLDATWDSAQKRHARAEPGS